MNDGFRTATHDVFGPVISDLTFGTPDKALALVKDADYGLSAGEWSDTWMDGFAEMPFGGYKESWSWPSVGSFRLSRIPGGKNGADANGRTWTPWVKKR